MGVGMYCKVCVALQSWSAEEGLGTEMAKPLWREAVVPLLSQRSMFSLLTDTRSGCRPRASCWIELGGPLWGGVIGICDARAGRLPPYSPAMKPVDCHLPYSSSRVCERNMAKTGPRAALKPSSLETASGSQRPCWLRYLSICQVVCSRVPNPTVTLTVILKKWA